MSVVISPLDDSGAEQRPEAGSRRSRRAERAAVAKRRTLAEPAPPKPDAPTVPHYLTVASPAQRNVPFDPRPVRLAATVVRVPACPSGYHGEHQVKVRIGGSGFPLVVAHGYTAHSRMYLLVLGLLARWFKVIAIDLAGHGGTDHLPRGQRRIAAYADLFLCTLERLGVQKALFVGHSLGGRVAAEAASMDPDLAAGLLLANSITGDSWDEQVRRYRRNPALVMSLISRLVSDSTMMLGKINQTDASGTLLQLSTEAYLTHLRAPWRMAPAGLAILSATPSQPILRKVGAAGIPTVVVWGENDPVVSLNDARTTAASAGGELIIVRQSGHSWPLADRRTLPEILQSQLAGRFGASLSETVRAAGLDPDTATKTDLERVFYRTNALALVLTPEFAHWEGHRPATHPSVVWEPHQDDIGG